MDRSEVKRIVDRHIEGEMERLGIPHWRITVRYDRGNTSDDPDWQPKADCKTYPEYNKALIRFNPEGFDDEPEVLASLRHELFHILLSPYDVLCDQIAPLVHGNETLSSVLGRCRTHASEQAVINLERMYRGLTAAPSPEKPRTPKRKVKRAMGKKTKAEPTRTAAKPASQPAPPAGKGTKKGTKKGC